MLAKIAARLFAAAHSIPQRKISSVSSSFPSACGQQTCRNDPDSRVRATTDGPSDLHQMQGGCAQNNGEAAVKEAMRCACKSPNLKVLSGRNAPALD